ncbi:hypothetical protein [Streptosporangium saharense]|uniref:hypothetical protein n=1 Tax=Streptosporangium saharense TaxID=1706840 RepID=UPI00344150CD
MSGFTFELHSDKVPRAARKKGVKDVFSGTAGPYGDVVVTLSVAPSQAVLTAPGLPEASLSHHDDLRVGLVPLDEQTSLSVGGATAILSQNRRALRNENRGMEIRLGDRHYTYLIPPEGEGELRDHERGPLVRHHTDLETRDTVIVVQPAADAADLALALILQAADLSRLTFLGTVVIGAWSLWNSGKGNM